MSDLTRDINIIIETAMRQSMSNTIKACRTAYLATHEHPEKKFLEFLETLDSQALNK